VNVKVQSHEIVMDGKGGRGSAVSKETQPVYAVVTINYSIVKGAALRDNPQILQGAPARRQRPRAWVARSAPRLGARVRGGYTRGAGR